MDMHFDGVIYQSYADELARRARYSHPPYRIVDVRDAADYDRGHIAGAIRATGLKSGLPEGSTANTEFFIIGNDADDERVRTASLTLRARGALRCVEVPGGMREWRQSGHPVESTS